MPEYRDEITPIARYIAGEMNRNARSPFVLGIRLYRIRPGWIWTENLVSQVRLSPLSLRARPYRP